MCCVAAGLGEGGLVFPLASGGNKVYGILGGERGEGVRREGLDEGETGMRRLSAPHQEAGPATQPPHTRLHSRPAC